MASSSIENFILYNITSLLFHIGTWFWCLHPCFQVQGIQWCQNKILVSNPTGGFSRWLTRSVGFLFNFRSLCFISFSVIGLSVICWTSLYSTYTLRMIAFWGSFWTRSNQNDWKLMNNIHFLFTVLQEHEVQWMLLSLLTTLFKSHV